jgi:hypothetical protein
MGGVGEIRQESQRPIARRTTEADSTKGGSGGHGNATLRIARFQELGGDWDALCKTAQENNITPKALKRQLVRHGVEVPDGRDAKVTVCSVDDCYGPPSGRGLCRRHYLRHMRQLGRIDGNSPSVNARATLARGGALHPPISLPFRHIAKTCTGCGELRTTPDHLIRKDSGPYPRCSTCGTRRALSYKRTRSAIDDEYKRKVEAQARAATMRTIGRLQSETLPNASQHHKEWTGPDLEMVLRQDLTVREIALRLGRTFAATAMARHRARHDPDWVEFVGMRESPRG